MLKALLTDIDGTMTDPSRRIHLRSIELVRSLVDDGVEVVLASGNASCFMDALCRMIGTNGTHIAENGGVFRVGYNGSLHIEGTRKAPEEALQVLQEYYHKQGKELSLLSPTYRFTDFAIARTVPIEEVETILSGHPVHVQDTGYAIHIQPLGINKGTALIALAEEMDLVPSDFLAIGDSVNDIQALRTAGIGVTVANANTETKAAAQYVAQKKYGDGFVEAIEKYYSYFRAR